MKKKRNSYLEQLRKKQASASRAPEQKPVSEMSDAELDAERERLEQQLRRSREQSVQAGREAVESTPSRFLFAGKKRKRQWK